MSTSGRGKHPPPDTAKQLKSHTETDSELTVHTKIGPQLISDLNIKVEPVKVRGRLSGWGAGVGGDAIWMPSSVVTLTL